MKLTAREIELYRPPAGNDHIVFDEELSGFGLRYRGGRRTWVFQSFGSGEGRVNARMTLGEYPALPPTKARETAQDLYAKVRLAVDFMLDQFADNIAKQSTDKVVVVGPECDGEVPIYFVSDNSGYINEAGVQFEFDASVTRKHRNTATAIRASASSGP